METIDILRTSLEGLGYTAEVLHLGRAKKAFLQLSHPDHSGMVTMSATSPLYPFATASARLICNDKSKAYDFAAQRGIAIPASVYVEKDDSAHEDAFRLLESHSRVIVKPLNSSVSNGLTLDVTSPEKLKAAILHAREFSEIVIIQQQVIGEEIRFVVLDGKVRAAILRQKPSVVGDGTSTLRQLIDKENEERKQLVDTAVPYPMLDEAIIDLTSLPMDKVYPAGERIELGKGTMIRGGASIFNVMATIDPSYTKLVEHLCQPLGKGFIVADMMLAEYTSPATSTNYSFIEFNLTPVLKLFYSCRDGSHFKVAETFLAPMIDATLRRNVL